LGLHLIIDGYNLIRSSESLARQERVSLAEGRRALLARLAAYRRIRPCSVTVVFDAAESDSRLERTERIKGIKVLYSPAGQSADRVIQRLTTGLGAGALVVTSDRELAGSVEAAGATAVSSPEFEDRMEMAFYMETKGLVEEGETEPPRRSTQKKGPSRRRPRSERRRLVRLRKV